MAEVRHQPVMPAEVIQYLDPKPGEVIVDGTIGLGGHSKLIAARLGTEGFLIGIDQDGSALALARENLASFTGKLLLFHDNFRNLGSIIRQSSPQGIDGLLLDLGVSSLQLDWGERGFSYQQEAALDMRMNPEQTFSAADLVNTYSQAELTRILREYGEERWASRIAQFIVEARKKAPLTTTDQLVEVIKAAIPAGARRTGPHPARRTFQAIRIAVNQELEALAEGLEAGIAALKPGGRIVVISFHSLEDRIVKRTFRQRAKACHCPPGLPVCQCKGKPDLKILTPQPVVPTAEECQKNPRSRSAKLRAAYKLV
ncbi:MAG TPA: 16S rRNA (cytosine(1402)-N(4))-methyltransferase RsmH [Firmicutes bacterium]|uniref:Ribosomal RNA small subunit methyltransferase H n=1 Tax=Capillibacterium thermochitinicola TaxID=2699427 RepID=A0A8J6HSZ7_9FIRM|nr:16S rRNA (cytosine(1402)-N(4))-methyltransferase RsmH [Capillibacterium thermochitinicola]MBA2133626.1 16S rRNA (cytosine(1402)-N(4))-methyltransferase RsmH [Capillibacterium thermochitinicola]HHW11736.1 16S rRNA (cytosine(1402)-N(4))-methyltransferase RsmH [Bacillota bacterium]